MSDIHFNSHLLPLRAMEENDENKILNPACTKHLFQDNIQDLRKRVTVLDCQLRKSESARKSFEVATEKLLQFVEVTVPLHCSIWKSCTLTLLRSKAEYKL